MIWRLFKIFIKSMYNRKQTHIILIKSGVTLLRQSTWTDRRTYYRFTCQMLLSVMACDRVLEVTRFGDCFAGEFFPDFEPDSFKDARAVALNPFSLFSTVGEAGDELTESRGTSLRASSRL